MPEKIRKKVASETQCSLGHTEVSLMSEYEMKIHQVYQRYRKLFCAICRNSYSFPIGQITKEEFKAIKKKDEEKRKQMFKNIQVETQKVKS